MTIREKILPKFLLELLSKLNYEKLYEIRIRSLAPLLINYDGNFKYVTSGGGVTLNPDEAYIIGQDIPPIILARACEFSLYAYNNRLREGYISLEGGVRIGIAGEIVYEGEMVKTIKNVSSLNIRLPHQIKGCSDKIFKYLIDKNNRPLGTLIISPPGDGKTTLLRDIARNFSYSGKIFNVTIADERCEIAAEKSGTAQLDVGFNSDIIRCCKKEFAFGCAIRSLSPDILITDELMSASELAACIDAANGGVAVIASAHAASLDELKERPDFGTKVLKAFKRFVVLSSRRGKGTVESVVDEKGNVFYEAIK